MDRGGSNEYPQSMFKSKNKKIMYIPVNPSFTIYSYKCGLRGSSLHERLRSYKVFFTKDQYFYLDYHKFSIKSYVFDVY